jgi:hypothetical protein
VTQLYPRALSSLFVASYDSQGYGGGILSRLHTEMLLTQLEFNLYNFGTDHIENIIFNNSTIVTSRVRCRGNVFTQQFAAVCRPYQPSYHNIYCILNEKHVFLEQLTSRLETQRHL